MKHLTTTAVVGLFRAPDRIGLLTSLFSRGLSDFHLLVLDNDVCLLSAYTIFCYKNH